MRRTSRSSLSHCILVVPILTSIIVAFVQAGTISPGTYKRACPRTEDIHPCNCFELGSGDSEKGPETVAFCKNIRHIQVLQDALKEFNGYFIDYFVMDGCKLPPFPNGLFHGVGVGWMEILNSTIQFQDPFFSCAQGCI